MKKLIIRFLIFLVASFVTSSGISQMRQVYADGVAGNEVYKISFYSPSSGYVAFRDWIGFTTDSGRTFTKKFITTGNVDYNGFSVNLTFGFGINGVEAFNQDTIIAYGDYGFVPAILYSTNGGNTYKLIFQSLYNPMQFNSGITDMIFPQNNSIGYAVDADRILKTTNKGVSWSIIRTDPGSDFTNLEGPDNNNVLTYSSAYATNKLLRTYNGGNSWQTVSLPYHNNGKVSCTYFINANRGWLNMYDNDNNAYVYQTVNGGLSWTLQNDPLANSFRCSKMRFTNDTTGYAINVLFTTFKTTDGGKVWEPLPRNNNFSYLGYGHNDFLAWNTEQLWAGGGHGFLELSTNGGGSTLPMAYFKFDTTNFYQAGNVQLLNFSKPAYQFKWFVNNTLISTAYNASYTHNSSLTVDTVKLVAIKGTLSDTIIKYHYFNPPVQVTSFTPTVGATGNTITITGINLLGATQVRFGGVLATNFTVVSSTQINAIIGNGASGSVMVTTPNGNGLKTGFTYFPPPQINLATTVSKSILCKSESIVIMLQNTEANVKYELVDSLNQSYGSVNSNGGTVSLTTSLLSRSGNYKIKASRLNVSSTNTFTNTIFILVEHTKSGFTTDKINISSNETVNYYQRSKDAQSFSWTFGAANISSSTAANPSGIFYTVPGQKSLMLISTSANGCKDTLSSNAVYVYNKPTPDDVCYVTPLDSQLQKSHVMVHMTKTYDEGFLLIGKLLQPASLKSRYGNAKHFIAANTSYIAKYTTDGILKWTMQFDNADGDFLTSSVDASGNIYMAGRAQSSRYLKLPNSDSVLFAAMPSDTSNFGSKTNGFLLKLDANGNYLWHTIVYDHTLPFSGYPYVGASISKIAIKNDHIVLIGDFKAKLSYWHNGSMKQLYDFPNSVPRDNQNNFILKIASDGTLLWDAHIINSSANAYKLSDAALDANGSSWLTGYYEHSMKFFETDSIQAVSLTGSTAYYRSYLIKLDANGKVKWHNFFSTQYQFGSVTLGYVVADNLGNSYITGRAMNWGRTDKINVTHSSGTVSSDSLCAFLVMKFDTAGRRVWGAGSRYPYYGEGYNIILKGNNIYASGTASLNNIQSSPFVFTSTNGQHQGIQLDQSEFFIANYDTSGVLKRLARSGRNSFGGINPDAMHIDNANNFFIAGGANFNPTSGNANLFNIPVQFPVSGCGYFMKLNFDYCYASTPPVANAGPDKLSCAGDTTRIGTTVSGDSYYWTSQPAGFTSSLANPVVTPTANTSYYLTVINAAGIIARDTAVVNTTVSPVANAGADQVVCKGTTVSVGAPSVAGYTYSWSSNPAAFNSTASNPSVTPLVTTSFYVTATNTNGCSKKDTVVVQVTQPVEPNVTIGGSSGFCSGYNASYNAGVTNGGSSPSYQWQVNGGNVGTNNNTYSTTTLVNGDQVRVIMTSSATCITKQTDTSSTITVMVSAPVTPAVTITAPGTTTCYGTNITFNALPVNGGNGPFYQWQVNGVNAGSNSSSFTTSQLRNNDHVQVIMRSMALCATPVNASSNVITMSIESANAGVDKSFCNGTGGVVIGSPAISGYTYSWTPLNGLSSGTIAQPTANPTASTTYYLSVNALSGCFAKDTVLVSVLSQPPTPVITLSGNVATSSSFTNNQWYKNDVAIIGATGSAYTITSNGLYTVKVSNGTCTSAASNAINFTTTAINSPVLNNNFVIGPNPVKNKLMLQYKGISGSFIALLLDISGKIVHTETKFTTTCEIDMRNLGAGTYIVHVVNQRNNESIQRLIVKL